MGNPIDYFAKDSEQASFCGAAKFVSRDNGREANRLASGGVLSSVR